jgi:hypothetical protein
MTDQAASSTSPTTSSFAALLARSMADQRAAATDALATIPARLAEFSRRLVALDRQLPAAQRRLAVIDALGDPGIFAAAELRRLAEVPGVAGVEADLESGTLTVQTAPILIAWNCVEYALGSFRLHLDLAGDVRIESVERPGPRAAWEHPHVQGGLPCLGNIRAGVLKLIAEYELALAAQVLIDFLQTYQPDEAYTPIEGWPKVDGQ